MKQRSPSMACQLFARVRQKQTWRTVCLDARSSRCNLCHYYWRVSLHYQGWQLKDDLGMLLKDQKDADLGPWPTLVEGHSGSYSCWKSLAAVVNYASMVYLCCR
jgi:hypothetical protein